MQGDEGDKKKQEKDGKHSRYYNSLFAFLRDMHESNSNNVKKG